MDKISIIVPIYNGEEYLSRCLDSLINQTYQNIEILCLNDGSQDNSLNILKKYQSKDSRIIIIDKKNSGVSDTRNQGIDKSTGKYLCFCDCDDFYEANYIETMYSKIKETNADIIKCNYRVIDTDGKLISKGDLDKVANRKYDKRGIKDNIIPLCLDGTIPCFCYLIMINKKHLKARFPLDIAMMEDVVFYLRLLLDTTSMYVIDDELYTIMYNPEGATNNTKNYERNILNIVKVNAYLEKELLKKDKSLTYLKEKINISNLTSISDFIFRHYLFSNEDTIKLCKNIKSDELNNIIDNSNLKEMNIQRRIIIKLLRKNKYKQLHLVFILRKIIYKLRRR